MLKNTPGVGRGFARVLGVDPWCAEATSGSWAGESRQNLTCFQFAPPCARTALSAITFAAIGFAGPRQRFVAAAQLFGRLGTRVARVCWLDLTRGKINAQHAPKKAALPSWLAGAKGSLVRPSQLLRLCAAVIADSKSGTAKGLLELRLEKKK